MFILRLHVAGDLYSPEYAEKWVNIMARCTRTTFFLYTRSWRCEEFKPVLATMAELENCFLHYSLDRDTGTPDDTPDRVRLAYMQTAAVEDPGDVDLIFRIPELRHVRPTRFPLSLVCSTENGQPKGDRTCTSCRRCFS